MWQKIIEFSLRNKLLIFICSIALLGWGSWSFYQLPVDAIPDITNNQVQVLTVCPTLATTEVEKFVTAPIEQELKSIPNRTELRSISRFGLSVITVVFDDDMDIFLARQLINEKLKIAEENIPAGFGKPELAPISTGLGEILHYRVETKKGYENKYDAQSLRTIQDWIVKKQLIGTPGVIEINSFGGFLKQYEIVVEPSQLRMHQTSINEIISVLEKANQVTGGSYIEKRENLFFIRADGKANSISDIENILVHNHSGRPLLIKDIAKVKLGNAVRYGAVSQNGKGETVLGIVMMLKGENASHVVNLVKEKIKEIEKTLPEGIQISTFLDREKLVKRTIRTVETNLLEGAIIVLLVLFLILGNFRAGLIIASVIPLCMSFAIGMMNLTGVSANLMSLGAIDFGLIIDGAVILVEASLFYIHKNNLHLKVNSDDDMDRYVALSTGTVIRSSIFGGIIILIVYLPIGTLVGVEGKMFAPMAYAIGYALLGSIILSLTYIPVASSVFLQNKNAIHSGKENKSERVFSHLKIKYRSFLNRALAKPKRWIIGSLVSFILALVLFMRLGGEFIPTLDEGDLMVHGFLRPGTSLTQTLESHRVFQKLLLQNFPDEIDQVISKIGTAEIPTDPMAIETADNAILLKPKSQWKKARTKEDLVNQIETIAKQVPGIAFEFTQPIKMRFDEMMTGVRSDIAIKLFGDDLEKLNLTAHKIEKLSREVEGFVDLKVEQVDGLPQIYIKYHHEMLARYGLNIEEVNKTIQAGFAGEITGEIFENEKRFNLVVRLDSNYRNSIEDVRSLPLSINSNNFVPLSSVASVEYVRGAAQISREEGQRRIVITVNVRGRDVESVIADIQSSIDQNLKLPIGYQIKYGGQFENLQAAKKRLSIAVPIALIMILLLLFFTFNSWKESLLVFSAIPLATIGGIFALYIRGLPFSISAGIGFIALFGVAVLNGIVLIAYLNELKKEGHQNTLQRILLGCSERLRPVLTTASVASFGFLPMALSHGAGAEVQRPLATVVIGGLITSTILTLIVLPILYMLLHSPSKKTNLKIGFLFLLGLIFIPNVEGQLMLKESEAIELILKNNPEIKVWNLLEEQSKIFSKLPAQWEPADIFHNITADPELGAFGTITTGFIQRIPSRKIVNANKSYNEAKTGLIRVERKKSQLELILEVRNLYRHLGYLDNQKQVFKKLDSLYSNFERISSVRYKTGEANNLEYVMASHKARQMKLKLETMNHEVEFDNKILSLILGVKEIIQPIIEPIEDISFSMMDTAKIRQSPYIQSYQEKINLVQKEIDIEKSKLSEIWYGGLNSQNTANGKWFPGYQIGVNLPIFRNGWNKKIEGIKLDSKISKLELEKALLKQQTELGHLEHEIEKYKIRLNDYYSRGKKTSDEIIRNASINYSSGNIDYLEFLNNIEAAKEIELLYIEDLYGLQLTINSIKSILGE
jgi:heavy metal efflux system protein